MGKWNGTSSHKLKIKTFIGTRNNIENEHNLKKSNQNIYFHWCS